MAKIGYLGKRSGKSRELEVGGWETGVRGREIGVRGPGSKVGSPGSEVRSFISDELPFL